MTLNATARWTPRARRLAYGAVALAALVGLGVAAWAARPTDPAERLVKARDLVFAGRPEAALREVRHALASIGEDSDPALRVEALSRAAQIVDFQLPEARLPEALGYYRELVRLAPRSPEAFDAGRRIAEILQEKLHDGVHAEAQYLAVADAFPHAAGSVALVLQAAKVALEGRRYDAARVDAERVLASDPSGPRAPEAQLVLGQAYELEGRLHDAVKAFDALADRWPSTPIAARGLFEAGNCLAEQADYEHAIARYVEALPDHPDPTMVQQSLARARRHFSAEQQIKPGSHAYAFARNQ